MDASDWDRRYSAAEMVWSTTPNQWVVELLEGREPGNAIDVAAGEGRNALWLAERGWRVTAADFSPVAIDRMRTLAAQRLDAAHADLLNPVVADATLPAPHPPATADPAGYDLVLFSYLQLPGEPWSAALREGVAAARPGGEVLVIAHARRNLEEGWGGPQDPAVLYDPDDVVAQAAELPAGLSVEVLSARLLTRVVDTEDGERHALDTVVVLRRR